MSSQSTQDPGSQFAQKGQKISPRSAIPVLAVSNQKTKGNLISLKAEGQLKTQQASKLDRQMSGEQILQSFDASRSQVLLQQSAPRTQKSNKIRIKEEKKYFDQYKRSSSRKHQTEKKVIRESRSTQNLPLESPVTADYGQNATQTRPMTNQMPRDFIIKRRSSKIVEMVEDENKADSFARDSAQALFTPLKGSNVERNGQSGKQTSNDFKLLTDKITVEDMSPENDIKLGKQRFSEGQTPIINKAQNQNTSQSLNLNQSHSQIQFNTLSNQQWTQSSVKKRMMQSQMSNQKQGFSQTAGPQGFQGKDQILYKNTGLDGTATRFWNGIMYNPAQVVNSQQNTNPLIPNFYFGPKYGEIQTQTSDKTKFQYFLKKEIEDYRNNVKTTKHTKKDLMIKMLIEEVERQHLRINYLETKVKDQKAKILKLEDAIFQRSHRLLLRCASNPNHREIYYCGKSAGGMQDEDFEQSSLHMSHRSKSRLGKSLKKSQSKQQIKLQEYLKGSKGIKGSFQEGVDIEGDQDDSNILHDKNSGGNKTNRSRAKSASHSNANRRDTSQLILQSYRNEVNLQTDDKIINSERDVQTENVLINKQNQTQIEKQDQTTQLEADDPDIIKHQNVQDLIERQSMIFKFQDQNISKVLINKEALLQEILGENQHQEQVKINTQALINDVEKFLSSLKQLNKLVECQQKIQLRSDRNLDFHKLLNEFQVLGSQIINCEKVLILMIDVPSEELIHFTEKEVITYKWSELFSFPIEKIKDKLIFNGEETVKARINVHKLQGIMNMKNSFPLNSALLCRFQVLGKQGLAIALDAQNFQISQTQQRLVPSFTSMDYEIVSQISTSCVRMLNRERDYDLKTRLIKAQKELFKIGINLNSRSNFASLLFEAELRLGELMSTSNVNILVIDQEEQLFFKINRKVLEKVHQTSESLNQFEVEVKESGNKEDDIANNGDLKENNQKENFLLYLPFQGLAHLSVSQKKTLLILQPQSYEEYHPLIDINFDEESKPIIIVPMINKDDDMTVQGCIEIEFKMKHYLSSNPLMGGNFGQFKLDAVTREVLEIFSNQVRISIERLNVLRRYQQKRPKIGLMMDNFMKEQQKQETFIANSLHHIEDNSSPMRDTHIGMRNERYADEFGEGQKSESDTFIENKNSFIKQDQERGQEARSDDLYEL